MAATLQLSPYTPFTQRSGVERAERLLAILAGMCEHLRRRGSALERRIAEVASSDPFGGIAPWSVRTLVGSDSRSFWC